MELGTENLFGNIEIEVDVESIAQEENDGKEKESTTEEVDVNDIAKEEDEVLEEDQEVIEEEQDDQEEKDNEEDDDDEVLEPSQFVYNQLVDLGLAENSEEPVDEEKLRETLDSLPERVFLDSISTLPPEFQELLRYGYNLGPDGKVQDLSVFFENYMKPQEVDYKENPREYLASKMKGNPFFSTQERIDTYLDDLEDEGTLASTAEQEYKREEQKKESERQKKLQEAEESRKERERRVKEYNKSIMTSIEEQTWKDDRKKEVLNVLSNMGEYNQIITSSPKAMVQLADLMTYFDSETGEFNLNDWVESVSTNKKTKSKVSKMKKDRMTDQLNRIKGVRKAKRRNNTSSKEDKGFIQISPEERWMYEV